MPYLILRPETYIYLQIFIAKLNPSLFKQAESQLEAELALLSLNPATIPTQPTRESLFSINIFRFHFLIWP